MPLFRLPNYAKDNETLAHTIRQQAAEQILDQLAVQNEHLESHIYFWRRYFRCRCLSLHYAQLVSSSGYRFQPLNATFGFMQRVETDHAVENVRKSEELKV